MLTAKCRHEVTEFLFFYDGRSGKYGLDWITLHNWALWGLGKGICMRKFLMPLVILVCGVIVVPAVVFGPMLWSTYEDRSDASEMIENRATMAEFISRFGEPMNEYQGTKDLPEKLREDLSSSVSENATFYYFSMEGLPYWSFFVAETTEGGRIDWGIVRPRP